MIFQRWRPNSVETCHACVTLVITVNYTARWCSRKVFFVWCKRTLNSEYAPKVRTLHLQPFSSNDFFFSKGSTKVRIPVRIPIRILIQNRLFSCSRVLSLVISIKLFIFCTEVLWESCSEFKTLKLPHSVNVLNMNSLAIIIHIVLYK